jgi:hypothetical protein
MDDFAFFRGLLLACALSAMCWFIAGLLVGWFA